MSNDLDQVECLIVQLKVPSRQEIPRFSEERQMQVCYQISKLRTYRTIFLVLALSVFVRFNTEAQSLAVQGVVSTSGVPVQRASVTFINSSDTTNQVSLVTDTSGPYSTSLTTIVMAQSAPPAKFELEQNYPNPFNPTTVIHYDVPRTVHVTLAVYDILGREVGTLVNANQSAGHYNVTFNTRDLPSGVYFSTLRGGDKPIVRKMLLLK